MSCESFKCDYTIGLFNKIPDYTINRKSKIGIAYAPTYNSRSACIFQNGPKLNLNLLTGPASQGGCGASFGPRRFNCAGTLTWKAIQLVNYYPTPLSYEKPPGTIWTPPNIERTLIYGRTWEYCGISQGVWQIYATWTPDRCAKNRLFITTKSVPTIVWIY